MSNEYVDLNSRATLLKNKLDMLSKKIQNPTSFATKESYMNECSRILKSFYSKLDKPFFNFEEARRDNSLAPITNRLDTEDLDYDYNLMWDQLLDNLILLFMEMENLESISLNNFNFAMVEANQLETRIKSVASKFGDYILYSQNTLSDVFLVKDSFNNLSKVDVQSPLLSEKECNVNQEEGIVTLPIIEQESKTLTIESIPVINDDSNGVSGNNQEIGKSHNGDLGVMLDNNADTWYEYEKVVSKSSEDENPLILDMVLDLGSPKVINHIIVNPNNFGTRTVLNIDAIETSMSGDTFTSIKQDIPITGATYETADEQDVFILAPATSQYAGQGIYTFTPRKTRYIHIIIRQDEPYVIQTNAGEKLRYAIGLRDITVKALKFESKGELITSPLSCPKEIRKVMLEGNQVPKKDSELTNISYLVSHDNGITWNPIQKKEETGVSGVVSIPEILNFNNSNVDSIKTTTPVTSVRLKMLLEREDGNFKEGVSSLFKKIETVSEIQGVPIAAPFTINLDHGPVEDTVVLVDPLFGSKGIKESSYYIKYNQNQSEDTFIGLPFKNINVPVEKNGSNETVQKSASDWLYVYVGGERWNQRTKDWKNYDANDTELNVFDFNPITGELSFSPESGYFCEQPPENAPISMHFGAERLFPGPKNNDHIATLDFPTSNSKEDFTILRYEEISNDGAEEIRVGATMHNLEKQNISSLSMPIDWGLVDFINGKEEFPVGVKSYSLDSSGGVIYFSEPAPKGLWTTYDYQIIHELGINDWDWSGDGLLRRDITIKDSGWFEMSKTDTQYLTNKHFLNLEKLAITKGSLAISASGTTNPFFKEVTYVNGSSEFSSATGDARQYSVNYEHGIVYLSQAFTGNVSYSYAYTKYEAKYRIARKVNPNHYTVNIPDRKIAIKDSEFFKYLETPNTTQSGKAAYYLVNYDYVSETREDVEELKDYFTPVIKDYILKILKKGNLF